MDPSIEIAIEKSELEAIRISKRQCPDCGHALITTNKQTGLLFACSSAYCDFCVTRDGIYSGRERWTETSYSRKVSSM